MQHVCGGASGTLYAQTLCPHLTVLLPLRNNFTLCTKSMEMSNSRQIKMVNRQFVLFSDLCAHLFGCGRLIPTEIAGNGACVTLRICLDNCLIIRSM